MTWLYFVSADDDGRVATKVGITDHLEQRLDQLCYCHPFEGGKRQARLFGAIWCARLSVAKTIEKLITDVIAALQDDDEADADVLVRRVRGWREWVLHCQHRNVEPQMNMLCFAQSVLDDRRKARCSQWQAHAGYGTLTRMIAAYGHTRECVWAELPPSHAIRGRVYANRATDALEYESI